MNELNQILQEESRGGAMVEEAKLLLSKEIQNRKEELAKKVEKDSAVSDKEKQEIIAEKEKEIQLIKKEFVKKTEEEIKKIKEKKNNRMAEAVKHIIDISFKE